MDSLKLNKNVCLICLEHNVTLNWLEEIEKFYDMSYKDCYYKYTGLQPITSEYFPSNLCELCSNGLKNAHLLFEKALESFKTLEDALKTKGQFDMETNPNQKPMNFEIKILDVCESIDLIKKESITDDKTLIDIGDEVMCPTNDYDNESVVNIKHATNNSITEEMSMNEDESNEPTHFSELLTEMDNELSQSSDTQNTLSSTTTKVKKKSRSYLCAYCSLKVNNITSLRAHEARHSENRKRTETCPQCGIKLYTKTALRNHMEIHTENRQKKFKCDYCDKAFYNRGGLNVHRRIHLGQMVPCRLCPKEFYRQVDLDKHLLIHSAAPLQKKSGKSKYIVQCQYCNKGIPSSSYRRHKAIHAGEPQVKCKVCDKDFLSRDRCTQHLRLVHHKTKDEYDKLIYYHATCITRVSHLMLKQQKLIQPVIS